jgi:malonate transporter and related proteins
MEQVAAIVLPVFGLIGIGYAVALSRVLPDTTADVLADFVFTIAVPVLIFRTIAAADFSAAEPWRLWLPFYAAFGLTWVAGTVVIRRVFHRDHRAGVVAGLAASYGNTVLIGIPLVIAAFGQAGAVPLALIIAVHMPLMMAASVAMIDRAERRDSVSDIQVDTWTAARNIAVHLVTNPIIIGIIAGLIWLLLQLPLGGLGGDIVNSIAGVASPLSLIATGMSLKRYGIARNVPAGLVLASLKLILMPAMVLLLVQLIAMPRLWASVAVIAAALPTGVNSYIAAARFKTGEALASNAIAISTGLAVFTTAAWLQVLALLGWL